MSDSYIESLYEVLSLHRWGFEQGKQNLLAVMSMLSRCINLSILQKCIMCQCCCVALCAAIVAGQICLRRSITQTLINKYLKDLLLVLVELQCFINNLKLIASRFIVANKICESSVYDKK